VASDSDSQKDLEKIIWEWLCALEFRWTRRLRSLTNDTQDPIPKLSASKFLRHTLRSVPKSATHSLDATSTNISTSDLSTELITSRMNSSVAGNTSAMAREGTGEVVGTRDIINTTKITANVSLTVKRTRDFAKMADL